VDLDEVAGLTEGYSGSDMKNVCVAAADKPLIKRLEKREDGRISCQAARPTTSAGYGWRRYTGAYSLTEHRRFAQSLSGGICLGEPVAQLVTSLEVQNSNPVKNATK
jgi:SpoVK/Ycf46/Vps4 family AAA+-type ATPase